LPAPWRAASKGYSITIDEAKEHTRARAKAVKKDLTDADLDGTSGVPSGIGRSLWSWLREKARTTITTDTGRSRRADHSIFPATSQFAGATSEGSAVAASSAAIDSASRASCDAARASSSWSRLVALTIGAVTDSRWSSRSRATVALLASYFLAAASRAFRTLSPLSSRYLCRWRPAGFSRDRPASGTCR
jgi:hypothetical protein